MAAKAGIIWRLSAKRIYSLMFQEKMTLTQAETTVRKIISLDKLLSTIEKDLYAQNKSLHGKFHYELRPTIQLAKKIGAQKVTLIKKESLRYDALLIWADKKSKKVECVTAMEHYVDSFSMEHLKQYHHTPAFHKMPYQENRNMTKNEQEEKIRDFLAPEIKKQFDKKFSKQTKTVYQNTILLIIIDDSLYEDKSFLKAKLLSVVEQIKVIQNDFVGIYLIGIDAFFFEIKNGVVD